MAQALWGSIEHFDPQAEGRQEYVERIKHFFKANGLIREDKASQRHSTFLKLAGPTTYKLLRNLIEPAKPKDKTFEQLVKTLADHYCPEPVEIMERFRFYSRVCQSGEPVNEYVADLRRLAKDCGFGDSLEKMLPDCLACGINDQTIQWKMLVEKDLTFKRTLEIAEGTQAADQNYREMRAVKVKEEPVNQVQDKPHRQNCHQCGYLGHLGNSFRHM